MEKQQAKIHKLEEYLQKLREQTRDIENMLEEERQQLCALCETQEGGHVFIRESDGDYHRPRWYHVCTRCHYSTQFR